MQAKCIAIDGPAGAGKSTLARRLSEALGFLYVDTGAIYRTVGLHVEQCGKHCDVVDEVVSVLDGLSIELRHGADGSQRMILQGKDVTRDIRHNRISHYASQVSAIPAVRDFLLDMQRTIAQTHSVVMDGRDIGTVVLPQADLKIFLTASPECRAERRYRELLRKGSHIPYAQVLTELLARDKADSTRQTAPLRQAEDALLLDNTTLTFEETLQEMIHIAKERLGL